MAKFPFVSVVMPVRNEGKFINRSLGAILVQDYPQDHIEIIVSDGMSTDETRLIIQELQAKHPNLKMIDNPQKIVAPGLNNAIRQAQGEIIIRVDGHCEIAPDYVSQCVRLLQERKVDAVGGPIETVGETFISKAIAVAMSSKFGVGGSHFRTIKDREMEADTVPFPAYPRRIFDKIGFLDEKLVRNQDDEFNSRLRKAGGKILLSHAIRSRYYSRGSLSSLWSQHFQYGYWKVRVMQKHPNQMKSRHFMPAVFVGALVLLGSMGIFLNIWRPFLILSISYLLISLYAAAHSAFKKSVGLFFILPVIYGILHLSYGIGFLTGLMVFRNEK